MRDHTCSEFLGDHSVYFLRLPGLASDIPSIFASVEPFVLLTQNLNFRLPDDDHSLPIHRLSHRTPAASVSLLQPTSSSTRITCPHHHGLATRPCMATAGPWLRKILPYPDLPSICFSSISTATHCVGASVQNRSVSGKVRRFGTVRNARRY